MASGKPMIDPSLTNEEKIKKLSKIVERLSRRSVKKTSAFITPIPISSSVKGDKVEGEVLKYMFPCPGKIIKGGVFFDKKPKNEVVITISLEGTSGGESKSYNVSRKYMSFESSLEVSTLDRMTISVSNMDQEDKITEVWMSFLWTPTTKDVEVKSFLIDELENDKIEE